MKKCEYCGSNVENGALYCPHCGASKFKVEEKLPTAPTAQTEGYNRSEQHNQSGGSNVNALAFCAIIFAIIQPFIGLILSIFALAKYKDESNRKVSKIALWISVILLIFFFIIL